ncbi:MAG: ATP-binding protein [Treponema sp.]|nr:ATP-binding protein [Treponema sp.]
MSVYIRRTLENAFLEANKYYPVLALCGQRQVGKSTMLNYLKEKDRKYVTFDDAVARNLAKKDPALFFETYGTKLIIDEFQRVPEILIEIKRIVDENALNGKEKFGLIWLTGSQKFLMMKNISDTLAGRVGIFLLSSFSQRELAKSSSSLFLPNVNALKKRRHLNSLSNIHSVYNEIFLGGMPRLRTSKIPRERFFMDYVNTYLERDIHDLEQVGKLDDFYNFLVCMAARTGQELKYDDISKNIGVSAPTVKSWISILERSGIIYILKPYYENITKRIVKTPKVYFLDTGLAAYLCRWPTAETLEKGAMSGAFFETFVVSEIVKSYYNIGKELNIYYYRDIDKKEIDLLFVDADGITPVEIKKAKSPNDVEKNFKVLEKLGKKIKTGFVICMADELMPCNRYIYLCPIGLI